MPLHCAATRPKFLNVPLFSKPCDLLTRDTWESNITIFNIFFVFFRLLSITLVSTSLSYHALIVSSSGLVVIMPGYEPIFFLILSSKLCWIVRDQGALYATTQ